MQGGGLARSGRADAQYEAIGLGDERLELAQIALAHAHVGEGNRLRGGQDAHDHVLVAVHGGQSRHPQLDGAIAHAELDLAVLGLALFRDIQPGHDLEARYQRVAEDGRDILVGDAVAVDAEADARALFLAVGLDVDVGGASPEGIEDYLVGQLDDGAVGFVVFVRLLVFRRLVDGAGALVGRELLE